MLRRSINTVSLLLLALATVACGIAKDDAARVAEARKFSQRGEFRAAAIELKNVLRSDPANVDARVLLGEVALESGDPASAAKELQRAQELGAQPHQYIVPLARALLLVASPDDVLTLNPDELDDPVDRAALNAVLGNAYLRKGELTAARQRFDAALADQPGHPDSLIGMARLLLDEGHIDGAEKSLQRVIAQQPESHAAYAVLGRLQLIAAKFSEAEKSFRNAASYADGPADRPLKLNYLGGLVDSLLLQNKSGEAQDSAAQMLTIAADHPYALFQSARADFESGAFDDAIESTQRVIASYPDYKPARLLLAAAAMSKDNFALAEIHLQTLVNADTNDVQARKLLAQTKMNLGSPGEALAALEPLLATGGADARLLAMAGSASLLSGKKTSGIELMARGVAAGASDPGVQLQGASSYIEAGEYSKALEILRNMPVEMQTHQYETLLVLALAKNSEIGAAREQAQRYIQVRPSDPKVYQLMGGLHLSLKENDQARTQYEKALALAPDNAEIVSNLAQIDVVEGDLDAAVGRFEKLLAVSPDNLTALISLAQLAEEQGRTEHAVKLMERARTTNPNELQPLLLLTRYYLRTNQQPLARERIATALGLAPENAAVLATLGLVQLDTGRHSEALGTLEKALRFAPNNVEARFNLARAQLKLGMSDTAIVSLQEIVTQNPNHLGARIALTRMQSLRGNYKEALQVASELKEQYPERAEPYVLEGDIHVMRGHYNDAIAAYDIAGGILPNAAITIKRFDARKRAGHADSHTVLEGWLADRPDDSAIRIALGQAYQENGLADEAISAYQQVLAKEPAHAVALNNLAWLYAELGGADNLARGTEIARKAHETLPGVGAITDTYGWLLLQKGDVTQARKLLDEASRQSPENPEIRYHLAVALHRAGAAQEARDLLDAILSGGNNFSSRDEARRLREGL